VRKTPSERGKLLPVASEAEGRYVDTPQFNLGLRRRQYAPIPRRRKGKPRRGPSGIPPEEWRNPGYLAFLHERRCIVCGRTPCDPCHGPVNGVRSKGADSGAVPMCREHHNEQTSIGWPKFAELRGVDREREATAHWSLYLIWRENRI
jgi:hypothetical protein